MHILVRARVLRAVIDHIKENSIYYRFFCNEAPDYLLYPVEQVLIYQVVEHSLLLAAGQGVLVGVGHPAATAKLKVPGQINKWGHVGRFLAEKKNV